MNLDDVRVKIDSIDNEMLELLASRVELVKEVGRIKHANNESIYRPEREAAILKRLNIISNEKNLGLTKEAIEAIYLEIFAVSRYIERPELIAYLGPEGSFTHQAAESRFGAVANYLPLATIGAVFDSLARGTTKYGVLPIENSNDGIVGETIDYLGQQNSKIIGELSLRIKQCLATRATELGQIKKIYSKDIAWLQCRATLEKYDLAEIEFIPVASTAKAAHLAANEPNSAAICSELAAKLCSLPILLDSIEDNSSNETRFLILSDFTTRPSGNDKTTILLQLENRPGTLREVLSIFENEGINLYKIESRPLKNRGFTYQFFIDFGGHIEDEAVQRAVANFKTVKWLGSYPRSVEWNLIKN